MRFLSIPWSTATLFIHSVSFVHSQTQSINSCFVGDKPSVNITFHSNNKTYTLTESGPPWMKTSTDFVFEAKTCDCAEYEKDQYYCPTGLDSCYTPRRWQDKPPFEAPFCANERANLVSFAISVSPGLYGLFMIVLILLCCSKRGEMAISCCCNGIFRGHANRVYASYLLQRDPELARAMVRQWCLRRWAAVQTQRRTGAMEADDIEYLDRIALPPRPTSLRLRTRAYVPPESLTELPNIDDMHDSMEDDDDDPCCMICFTPFAVNDRIGDLDCKHEFHSDCLKTWLKKNNSCPLCMRSDIAESVFNEVDNSAVRT